MFTCLLSVFPGEGECHEDNPSFLPSHGCIPEPGTDLKELWDERTIERKEEKGREGGRKRKRKKEEKRKGKKGIERGRRRKEERRKT